MKRFKSICALLMCLLLAFPFAACGENEQNVEQGGAQGGTQNEQGSQGSQSGNEQESQGGSQSGNEQESQGGSQSGSQQESQGGSQSGNEQESQGGSQSGNEQESQGGSQSGNEQGSGSGSIKPSEGETGGEQGDGEATKSGFVLVVYFSATNHTETVAGYIAEATHGDLFELIPVEPYSSDDLDWTDRNSRVSKEHDDKSLQNIELEKTSVEGWENYDTVFIGYPIWWGEAAWPVNGFVTANDFTGKTVIPFCTSSSSGLGQSGELLAEMAGTGEWLEGKRFQSSASEATLKEWVESLEIDFEEKRPEEPELEATATLAFERDTVRNGYIVTGDEGQAEDIVIPAEHESLPVVGIADSAFAYSRHTARIRSITIPDSVEEIGKNAFYARIDDLTTVKIGTGSQLKKIGNNAFSGCRALTAIYLPAGLDELGDDVFNNCGGLNTITVAEENTHYSGEGNCLIDLSTQTLLRGSNQSVIPDTVKIIGVAAFRKATLTELTIPASVTTIEKYAVQDCAITKIVFEGTSAQWEKLMEASSKYWNLGNKEVQITCSDDNA